VTNEDVDSDWLLHFFGEITNHKRLQSLGAVSSTAQVVHLNQHSQQLLLGTGSSFHSSGTN
jgi:hypothetical protein